MRYVELMPGIRSSALAFGCASMMGAIGRRQAEAAIGTALEVGITHFDVARSYGFGEAEKLLGRSLSHVRDQVVIATKFGFEATPLARLLGPVKPIVRKLRGKNTRHAKAAEGGGAAAISSRWQRRITIDAAGMRRSVEQSLRALGTDYLDYLFFHEPGSNELNEGIFEEVTRLKSSGKIRGFGTAGYFPQLIDSIKWLNKLDLCQFELSVSSPHYQQAVMLRGHQPNVLFSVLRNRPSGVSILETIRTLNTDMPSSVILMAMFTPEHILANAAALS